MHSWRRERERLAADLVEPIQGSAGMIPAERSYLEMLREVTTRFAILALFNEGTLIDPRGGGSLSTACGDAEVDRFIEALEAVLARLPVAA
jgi:glutamate-1-semialdehyde aminotransferase